MLIDNLNGSISNAVVVCNTDKKKTQRFSIIEKTIIKYFNIMSLLIEVEVQKLVNEDDGNIHTFDGNEFIGKKPVPRKTLYKIMKMLKILEERWDRIATAELNILSLETEEELPLSKQSRSLSDIEMNHPILFYL